VISGIQQIGIGVPDLNKAWDWYDKNLGFSVPVFEDAGSAELMKGYTGGAAQNRHAALAINMQGGGGLELWQYSSREPKPPVFNVKIGDLGINAARIKTLDIKKAYEQLRYGGTYVLGDITSLPDGTKCFCLKDPYGNIIRIEESSVSFTETKAHTGGVIGAVIGVSNMDKSIGFYRDILGCDKLVYDVRGSFLDLPVLPGGDLEFRRVMLTHSKPRQGAFSRLLGSSGIELIQVLGRKPQKIFKERYWGDLGYIHLCFDIHGMPELRRLCKEKGCPFTVDSNPDSGTFNMGEASGSFSYTEDPDGTLIEFVETKKIPLIKKLGWDINLSGRNHEKPLPDWMLKTLKWNKRKI
jgi:catechol 2,3-dioxygenase-like lactoylglutathione lyase family enzyme